MFCFVLLLVNCSPFLHCGPRFVEVGRTVPCEATPSTAEDNDTLPDAQSGACIFFFASTFFFGSGRICRGQKAGTPVSGNSENVETCGQNQRFVELLAQGDATVPTRQAMVGPTALTM